MRIALVVLGGLHPTGRVEVVPLWLSLIERLARRHEVHAFVLHHLDRPQSYALRGAQIHDLGSPARSALIGRWAQWRALEAGLEKHGPFDVIHGFWADPAGVLASAATRFLGVPSVVTFDSGELVALRDIDYGLQRTWHGRAAVRLAARWATRLHVASACMEMLAHARGLDVVRIPLGVDPARVPAPSDRRDGPPWRLLQIASLNRVKDHRTLIEALALASRDVDVHLDLVGEDTLDGEIERHATQQQIAHRATFHGFVAHDTLPALRARAHLYVQSSRHEASGVAVLEAAASGLPIVGTRVGYVADWSPDGATAVEVANPSMLADAIVTLLRDPHRRRQQAHVAQQFALEHDVDWSVEALEGLYQDTIHRFTGLTG